MKPFPHLPISCQVGKRRWKVICRSGSVCRSANHLAVVYRHHQLKLVESVRNIANLRFIENTCCTGTHHTDFTAHFNMCEWFSWVSAPLSNGDLVKNKAPKHRVKHGVPMLKPCCPAMGFQQTTCSMFIGFYFCHQTLTGIPVLKNTELGELVWNFPSTNSFK